jgi:hypothetical protein
MDTLMKRITILMVLAMLLALPVFGQDSDQEFNEIQRGWEAAIGKQQPTKEQSNAEHAAFTGDWAMFVNGENIGLRTFTGRNGEHTAKMFIKTETPTAYGARLRYDIYWPFHTMADRMTIVFKTTTSDTVATYKYEFIDNDTIHMVQLSTVGWYEDFQGMEEITFVRQK